MAEIASIQFRLDVDAQSKAAMSLSFAQLIAAIDASNSVVETGDNGVILPDDLSDLIGCELVGVSASGTLELKALKFLPSDGYIELFTAIAGDGGLNAICFVHDWPILSVVCANSTVAKAGGVASLAREGVGG